MLILLVIGLYFVVDRYVFDKNKMINKPEVEVALISDLDVEIYSEISLLSFIDDIKNGSVMSSDTLIDTSKLGKVDLELVLSDLNGEEVTYKFQVNIVDKEVPVISAKKEISIFVGNKIDLLDGVVVSDNSKEDIDIKIEGNYDFNTVGEYKLKYTAVDSSGNKGDFDFVLKVINDPNNYTFTTNKGFIAKVIDGVTYIEGVLIVNKTYDLPSDYGNGLTSETLNAFNDMRADAASLGLNIYISSGYRSYYDQRYIYNNYVSYDGVANADTYSARAGHSEHQTGLAFDLNSIDDSFTYTDEGKWVHDNCYKYGLILRYPKGKDAITGYMHESWHLRYVGIDLATKLYNNGDWITLEEYYGIDSKYN